MKAKIFLTGLALVAAVTFASAQNQVGKKGNGNGTCNGTTKCTSFVDANNNGVCDTYETRTTNASAKKGNGTGTCTGNGQGQRQGKGKGKNFVDTNNNGVCDTYEAQTKKFNN